MGQKVNPIGYRIGFNKTWDSRWFADRLYGSYLAQDIAIRKYVKKEFGTAGINKIVIERSHKKINVYLHVARPGLIIGKKGVDIEKMKTEIAKVVGHKEVFINVVEVKKADMQAQLIAESVAGQLEKRVSFRRAMKKSMQTCMKMGGQGIKISCSGRLGGAEIARREWYKEGRVPLHTIRSDIDFGMARANTTYGVIGVTVHVYKGEKIDYQQAN
jgi:small subunit ribosomal protein S3